MTRKSTPEAGIERRIAGRLADLRAEQGWSLETLAERSGISRSTLSRIERSELSPTAAILGRLCTVYGWTLSRFMAEAETRRPDLVRARAQTTWQDPETGYRRRMVSPPSAGLRGEVVEVSIPAGGRVSYDTSPVPGLEHHLWVLSGTLAVEVGGMSYALGRGDCLRYLLSGPSRFHNSGKRDARYVIAIVNP